MIRISVPITVDHRAWLPTAMPWSTDMVLFCEDHQILVAVLFMCYSHAALNMAFECKDDLHEFCQKNEVIWMINMPSAIGYVNTWSPVCGGDVWRIRELLESLALLEEGHLWEFIALPYILSCCFTCLMSSEPRNMARACADGMVLNHIVQQQWVKGSQERESYSCCAIVILGLWICLWVLFSVSVFVLEYYVHTTALSYSRLLVGFLLYGR